MKKIVRFIIPFILATLLIGCIGSRLSITLSGDTKSTMYGFAEIVASPSTDVEYNFVAEHGKIIQVDKNKAIWAAPLERGKYTIDVVGTKNGKPVITKHTVDVVAMPADTVDWRLTSDNIGGKNAKIDIMNYSDKTITALRVIILMWNNFGERIDYLTNYRFRGQAGDIRIAPNQERTYTWSLYWAKGVTNIVAWVYEVAFEDGTTWSLYH